jgi:phosphoribosylformimino-5-aminoimidazole carboxamide ribotide isomerase
VEIIPAIDLKDGRCVRLQQGREDTETAYSLDPVAMAREWVRLGARRLHVVNLDGAFGRASQNIEIFRRIACDTDAVIEFGGGLRTFEDIERAFGIGAAKAVLGTVAVESPDLLSQALERYGPDRIIVALDGKGGKVATRGWQQVTDIPLLDACNRMIAFGVKEVLYTDIDRDGMMDGMDLSSLRELARLPVSVIASGGVSSADDVRALLDLNAPHITGVIVGKALYEKRVSLQELLDVTRGKG